MRVRPFELVVLSALALVLGVGATVGDIGSCGRAPTDLDERSFASARKRSDCTRCIECALTTQTCRDACDSNVPSTAGWPATCHPLDHDGEVCLRALTAAGCGRYASFVDDVAPAVPTECDFCRLAEAGVGSGEP